MYMMTAGLTRRRPPKDPLQNTAAFFAQHLGRGRDPALAHVGDQRHTIDMHAWHVDRWLHGQADDPGPWLMGRLGSDRTMRVAFAYLRKWGGRSAGPDGMTLDDLDNDSLTWQFCRNMAEVVRAGIYQPGPLKRVKIPKGPGRGHRTLAIPNLQDRLVGRALVEIIGPIFDPTFQPFSFGWRPGHGRLDALATLFAYARHTGSWCWAVDDVKDAFGSIPRARMLAACRRLLPDDLVAFIERFAAAGRKGRRGIAQGGPASPLLTNVHFDTHLDTAWYRQQLGEPLFRTADDLVVCGAERREAGERHERLKHIARSNSGTPLKGGDNAGVRDLRAGEPVDWLGFRIRLVCNRLAVQIGPRAWWRLEDRLRECHDQPNASQKATDIVRGWIGQMGPAYREEPIAAFRRQLHGVAEEAGFKVAYTDDELEALRSAAHERFGKLYNRRRSQLLHQLWLINDWRSRRPRPHRA